MQHTINQRLKQVELAIKNVRAKSSYIIKESFSGNNVIELEKERELLLNCYRLYHDNKQLSQKEYEAYSLLYSMKEKMNKLYNQHLRYIKPVLHMYPKFWKDLDKAEKNAKGFSGWLNHMREFYYMLLKDSKYKNILLENSVDTNELYKGQILIQGLLQAFRKQQKCSWESWILSGKLKRSLNDLESWKPEFNQTDQLLNYNSR